MRSRLLCATALVAAAAVLAQPARAEEPIRLSLSGNMYGFASYASQDDGPGPDGVYGTPDDAPGADRRSFGLSRRGRIHFSGDTVLDNGLQVGVEVRLNALDCTDQVDQGYVWFDSSYGRLELGKTSGPGDKLFIGAPNPVPHLGLNTPDILVVNQTNTAGNGTLAATPATVVYTTKLERLNYFTPRILGVRLGLSYIPVQCAEGNAGAMPCGGSYAGMPADNIPRGYDYLEAAASFEHRVGQVDLGLYGGYFTSSNGKGVVRTVGVPGTGEQSQWGASASLGHAGFTLGGGWRRTLDDGFDPDRDSTDWNLGLTYGTGPWSGGVQYAGKRTTLGAREDSFDGVSVGGSYALGPGILLIAGIQYYDWGTDSPNPAIRSYATNRAWSASLGTAVEF